MGNGTNVGQARTHDNTRQRAPWAPWATLSQAGARLIGVNNRNLHTFKVSQRGQSAATWFVFGLILFSDLFMGHVHRVHL